MEKGNGWNAVFWCNHDQPRIVSRFGNDDKYHKESAKMLATTIHMMRGTPYIFQGEEIGMTNSYFNHIELYRDVETLNYYQILRKQGKSDEQVVSLLKERSRDNARTPVQWNNTNHGGFTTGEPWIKVNNNYKSINVQNSLRDKESIFYYYKRLIKIRKEMDVVAYGDYQPILEKDPRVFAYMRSLNNEKILVINNFYGESTVFNIPDHIKLDEYSNTVLISNYQNHPTSFKSIELKPYQSIVFHLVK